jgi:hypothetical protein
LNKSFFIDIDGTIVKHRYDPEERDVFLDGAIEFLKSIRGERIILTTARQANDCKEVLTMLAKEGIIVYKLISGLPTGPRYLINDYKDINEQKAFAINLKRDRGFDGNTRIPE